MPNVKPPTISTLEQWRTYAAHEFVEPVLLSRAEYDQLSPSQRAAHNKIRTDWFAEPHVVVLPTVEAARRNVRDVIRRATANVVSPRDTWYAVLTGAPTTGKTTAATWLGRKYEQQVREATGRKDDPTFAPVVYVEMPGTVTEKNMMGKFLTFLGLPEPPARVTMEERTDRVVKALRDLDTSLVIIDDIHLVRGTSSSGRDSANTLTQFSRRVAAGFVYAGVDVQDTNLFAGPVGQQTKGRAKVTRFTNYGYSTDAQRETWLSLVLTVEADLCLFLYDHPAQALAPLAEYLWNRTAGNISSLTELLRTAAADAVDDGTERVTRQGLELVTLDEAASEAEQDRHSRLGPSDGGGRAQ